MARTRDSSTPQTRKIVASKASRSTAATSGASSNGSKASGSARRKSSGGGGALVKRAVPGWQKSITAFLQNGADTQEDSDACVIVDDEGPGTSSKSCTEDRITGASNSPAKVHSSTDKENEEEEDDIETVDEKNSPRKKKTAVKKVVKSRKRPSESRNGISTEVKRAKNSASAAKVVEKDASVISDDTASLGEKGDGSHAGEVETKQKETKSTSKSISSANEDSGVEDNTKSSKRSSEKTSRERSSLKKKKRLVVASDSDGSD